MAEENKPAFKDARTAKELLAQLRSEADLLATDLVLQQMLYCLVFVANLALIGVAGLKMGPAFSVGGIVASGFVLFFTLTVVGAHCFLWLDKKTYANTVRSYGPVAVEQFLETMVTEQLARMEQLISYRKSVMRATACLAGYLGLIGVVLMYAAATQS